MEFADIYEHFEKKLKRVTELVVTLRDKWGGRDGQPTPQQVRAIHSLIICAKQVYLYIYDKEETPVLN